MNKNLDTISFAVHPILFCMFPVLFLYVHNIEQTDASVIITPLLISIISATVLLAIFCSFFSNSKKAGILVSMIVFLFFSYGHFLELSHRAKLNFVNDAFLLILCAIIFAACVFFIVGTRRDLTAATRFLNFTASFLVVMSLFQIMCYQLRTGRADKFLTIEDENKSISGESVAAEDYPDIYYIILDGYARYDILEDIYNFRNDEFYGFLRGKGFFIADRSNCNYMQTFLSLASSLNMNYINFLEKKPGIRSDSQRIPYQMIQENEVMNLLRKKGYTVISFSTGVSVTENIKCAEYNIDAGKINEFTVVLLKTTLLAPMADDFGLLSLRRYRVRNTFEGLARIKKIKGPTFTFAHILPPHPPYLFDRNGLPVRMSGMKHDGFTWELKDKYIDQLVFINKKLEALIDVLVAGSGVKPVIILQADHGSASLLFGTERKSGNITDEILRERFGIFFACYLQGKKSEMLYDRVSPVNLFRGVFNTYFRTEYDLLPDKCYYSETDSPYRFTEVTAKVSSN